MSSNQKNKPVDTIRDRAIKATIWPNFGDNGTFYTVEFSRTYKDEKEELQNSHSFSGSDLLKLAHLAPKAYDRIIDLKIEDVKASK